MSQTRNFYEVLGVSKDASDADIRGAYRRLAIRYHPDKNPGDTVAEERFKELGQAYAVLSDPGKRAQYDQQLRYGFPAGGFPPSGDFGGFDAISTDEILRRFGSLFGDAFGVGFGEEPSPFRRGVPNRRRGRDVEASVRAPFRAAALGESVEVTLHGTGGQRTLAIRLPAGTKDGATLRLRGQGEPGARGGPSGDLFLRVRVDPDAVFRRRGRDIEADLAVPAPIAVLGGKVTVQTLAGEEGSLTIPPGTTSGAKLRLRGRGINGGDHIVRVMVSVPREPTAEERELYERLRDLGDSDGN